MTNQYQYQYFTKYATNLVNILFLDIGVLQDLLDGLHGLPEEVDVKFFEFGTGKRLREVVAILEALDFDASALLARECPFGFLDLALEFPERTKVLGDVGAGLLLVRLNQVINNTVVEIFSTKMCVTSGSQDLEDAIVDGKQRHVESSPSKIVDDDLGFTSLLVETVSDGSGSGFVDDT